MGMFQESKKIVANSCSQGVITNLLHASAPGQTCLGLKDPREPEQRKQDFMSREEQTVRRRKRRRGREEAELWWWSPCSLLSQNWGLGETLWQQSFLPSLCPSLRWPESIVSLALLPPYPTRFYLIWFKICERSPTRVTDLPAFPETAVLQRGCDASAPRTARKSRHWEAPSFPPHARPPVPPPHPPACYPSGIKYQQDLEGVALSQLKLPQGAMSFPAAQSFTLTSAKLQCAGRWVSQSWSTVWILQTLLEKDNGETRKKVCQILLSATWDFCQEKWS